MCQNPAQCLAHHPRLACFCCSELLCRETERLTEKAACRQDVESVCWSDQASVQSSECKCNFHSFLQQPYHPYSQGSILAQSSSELTASCICAAEKPTITLLSPQCSARLSGVSHGSGTHNRQTDCLWLGLLRVFGQKLEKADQLDSLPAELPVYCSSLNVWKCQTPADFFPLASPQGSERHCGCRGGWEDLPLSRSSVFAIVGHHKSFVFLISKHCHRGHGKGKSTVWRSGWGKWRSLAPGHSGSQCLAVWLVHGGIRYDCGLSHRWSSYLMWSCSSDPWGLVLWFLIHFPPRNVC